MTFCSAASRMAQVLMTTRSASSIAGASAQPAASRRPAISSESLWFIWQPRVQTKKRGSAWSSGRNSSRRASSGAGGGGGAGGPAGRRDVEDGQARGSSGGGASGRCSVHRVAGLACPRSPRAAIAASARPRGHPERGVRLGVRFVVAMVVAATRGNESEDPGERRKLLNDLGRKCAVVHLEAAQAQRHQVAHDQRPLRPRRRSGQARRGRRRR